MDLGSRLRERMHELEMSVPDLARKLDVSQPRLRYWINNDREPDLGMVVRLADALQTSPDWLLGVSDENNYTGSAYPVLPGYLRVPLADARAGMGGPGAILSEMPVGYRYVPEDELRGHNPENLWAHRAEGDSMMPDLQDGDLLIIDTAQRNPSPPRIFTIWDGFGLVTKYVERIIGSNPPKVRLISSNAKIPPYEVTIGDRGDLDGEEAFIVGRVVFVQRAL